jgi:hypothetical protein
LRRIREVDFAIVDKDLLLWLLLAMENMFINQKATGL